MKRFSKVLVVILTFMMVFSIMSIPSSAAPTTLPWKGISNKIAVGETVDPSIYFNVTPQKAKKLRFTSNTPSIIKVVNNKIKGLKVGTGKFTTKDTETGKTVVHTIVVVKELTWKKISNKINIGETVNPVKYFTVNPASRASKLVFTSKDESIVKVVNNKLVGVTAGVTKFVTRDPETGASETHTIIVKTKLTWKKISNKIKVGETVDPVKYFDVEPKSKEKDLVFTMKDPSNGIARVVDNKIVGIAPGSTRFITKDPETGVSQEHTIIVVDEEKAPSITINNANDFSSLHKGDTKQLDVTVTPSSAKVTYEVANGSAYVEVDSNGNVKGKDRGTATINITAENAKGTDTATVEVKVLAPFTEATIKDEFNNGDKIVANLGSYKWTDASEFTKQMQELITKIASKIGLTQTDELCSVIIDGNEYKISLEPTGGLVIKDAEGTVVPTEKFWEDGKTPGGQIQLTCTANAANRIIAYMEKAQSVGDTIVYDGIAMSAVNFIGYDFTFGPMNKVTMVYRGEKPNPSYTYVWFAEKGCLYFEGDVRQTPVMVHRFNNPDSDYEIFEDLNYPVWR